jgi:hypothetical protein
MARIDKDVALAMFRTGETDSSIAARFGTSRQAVNLLRKAFAKAGQLQVPSAALRIPATAIPPSGPAAPLGGQHTNQVATVPEPPASPTYPTYDQISDWVIRLIREAGDTARIRQENAVLRQRADGLLAEVLRLQAVAEQAEQKVATLATKSTQYQNAILQSKLPPPANG